MAAMSDGTVDDSSPDLVAEALLGCSLAPAADAFTIEVLAANAGAVGLTLPGHALHQIVVALLGLLGRQQALIHGPTQIVLPVMSATREAIGASGRELLTLTTSAGAALSFLVDSSALDGAVTHPKPEPRGRAH